MFTIAFSPLLLSQPYDESDARSLARSLRRYGRDHPFKLGDFGCAVQLQENGSPKFIDCDIREGDCRYLPTEVLNGEYTSLPSADIFSLGMTVHELVQGGRTERLTSASGAAAAAAAAAATDTLTLNSSHAILVLSRPRLPSSTRRPGVRALAQRERFATNLPGEQARLGDRAAADRYARPQFTGEACCPRNLRVHSVDDQAPGTANCMIVAKTLSLSLSLSLSVMVE